MSSTVGLESRRTQFFVVMGGGQSPSGSTPVSIVITDRGVPTYLPMIEGEKFVPAKKGAGVPSNFCTRQNASFDLFHILEFKAQERAEFCQRILLQPHDRFW